MGFTFDNNYLKTSLMGSGANFPDNYQPVGLDNEYATLLAGAHSTCKAASQAYDYISAQSQAANQSGTSFASAQLVNFANTNLANSKAIIAVLNALQDVYDQGEFDGRYGGTSQNYQAIRNLLYCVLPYIGLLDPYGNTRQSASDHLMGWNEDMTLCYYNGMPVMLKYNFSKPICCAVAYSTQGIPLPYWSPTEKTGSGSISIDTYNMHIYAQYNINLGADPEFSTKYDKIGWKPLNCTIAPDATYWSMSYSNDSDINSELCFGLFTSTNPTKYVTIDEVTSQVAETGGFYNAISDVLDMARSTANSLSSTSIFRKLDNYENNAVASFKERFVGFEYVPLKTVLATVCGAIQDTYADENSDGSYNTISSNPNFISNVLQVSVSLVIDLVTSALSILLTCINYALGLVMSVLGQIVNYIRENVASTEYHIETSSQIPTFNVASPAAMNVVYEGDTALLSEVSRQQLLSAYAIGGVVSLGGQTPRVRYSDGGFIWSAPRPNSRLVELIFSDGKPLESTPSNPVDKMLQFAFVPSSDGAIFMPFQQKGSTQGSFSYNASGNTLVATPYGHDNCHFILPAASNNDQLLRSQIVYPNVNYDDLDIYNYTDDRMAFEFGAAVCEWIIRCGMSRLAIDSTKLESILTPNVTDASCVFATLGVPSYSNEVSVSSNATWKWSTTANEIDSEIDTAAGQFGTWVSDKKALYKAYIKAISFATFHAYTGSMRANWEDVINLFNEGAAIFKYPTDLRGVLVQRLNECGAYCCPVPAEAAIEPVISLPNVSKKSLILASLAVGAVAAITAVTAIMVKRAIKKGAITMWHKASKNYQDALTAYNANPTVQNSKALYKANQKLGRRGKYCKLLGVKSVGGWDPSGYYSSHTPVPKATDSMGFSEWLSGPATDKVINDNTSTILHVITGD